ncbi:MAG TPA: tryptophan 2,3-dioxygenase family protein [Vicinamibacterales bacterium]|nr:tryptophan 2,3-dioxygenase family protein [Vicinamibacterales bacterium]
MTGLNDPILPGPGASDYERYLRTDELLALQKTPDQMAHRDELLFQTIHQSSELWMKLACFELETSLSHIESGKLGQATRLVRRAVAALDQVLNVTLMLENLAPWDYHGVRSELGHGSGFDSPGFRHIHDLTPKVAQAFTALTEQRRVSLRDIYRDREAHEDLFDLAERLMDWDQRLVMWRTMHLKLVERVIGGSVIGTQGTPVEVLGRRLDVRYFQPLWDIRNALTEEAGTSPG